MTEKTLQAIEKAFDKTSHSLFHRMYSILRAGSFNAKFLSDEIGRLCDIEDTDKPIQVLEVGCGSGYKTPLLKNVFNRLGYKKIIVEGIDLSARSLQIAKTKNSNVEYIHGNFLDQDFKNKKFDYLFIAAVWHHFPDPNAAISKISNVLKPNGAAFILDIYYPKNKFLKKIVRFLQNAYKIIASRKGVYYNDISVPEIKDLVDKSNDMSFSGRFKANGIPALIGTQMVVIQKLV